MPINTEKMKQDNFAVKLPEDVFDPFVQNVCAYFTTLSKNMNHVSPVDSIDVISTLAWFREYFSSESEWEQLTLNTLGILRKGIQRSHMDTIAIFGGLTHVAFALYDLSITTPKIRPLLLEINELLLKKLTVFLEPSNKKEFYTVPNYEVISGLSGPLRYLLTFDELNDDKMKAMAERIVDVFIKRSEDTTVLGQRAPGWHYYPSDTEAMYSSVGIVNGCINYGVSHGMGGPLAALSLAYNKCIRKSELEDVIGKLIAEFKRGMFYVNGIAYWHGKIGFEHYIGTEEMAEVPSQMSWCYGSPGILRALYMAGVSLSDQDTTKLAQDELIKIVNMDIQAYLLQQDIVCHGHVGTAAIFNLMYQDTGHTDFLNKTLEMVKLGATLTIEQFMQNEIDRTAGLNLPIAGVNNHLEGYSGIIQTILSIIKGHAFGNEKRLLMI